MAAASSTGNSTKPGSSTSRPSADGEWRAGARRLAEQPAARPHEVFELRAQRGGHRHEFEPQHARHFEQGRKPRVDLAAFDALHRHAREAGLGGQRFLAEAGRLASLFDFISELDH
jgi:hypothetical protein